MKNSIKLLGLAVVGALSLAGFVRSVYASQLHRSDATIAQGSSPSHPNDDQDDDDQDNDQDDHGDDDRGDDDQEVPDQVEEQQEDAQLRSLAKITPQQAEQAARTVASGEVSHLALENEDGNVVYKVVIGQQEVLIDAGNGQVLETETANTESAQDSPLRSSIQAPADQEPDQEIE